MALADQVKDNTNKASKIPESTSINGDIYRLKHYSILGQACHFKKDYSCAEAAYKEALKISLNVHGELDSQTTACFFNLGTLYVDFRNTKEAEKCLIKALNIQLRTSAKTHSLTAQIYFLLSVIYKWTNRYKEALCALEKTLKTLNSGPTDDMNFLSIVNKKIQKLRDIIEKGINIIHII